LKNLNAILKKRANQEKSHLYKEELDAKEKQVQRYEKKLMQVELSNNVKSFKLYFSLNIY